MSGSNVGRRPLGNPQWARDTEARLRALEQRGTARIGSWTLVDIDGQLLAVKPGQEISLDGSPIRADVDTVLRGYATAPEVGAIGRDVGALIDSTVTNYLGQEGSNYTTDQASVGQQTIVSTLQANTSAVQQILSEQAAEPTAGVSYSVDFSSYPNGAFPDIFELTYSGPGSGNIEIRNSKAHWVRKLDGDRSLFAYYAPPGGGETTTDYQLLSATLATAMGVGANNGFVARCNAAKDSYVFAYGTGGGFGGFVFTAFFGWVVDGVATMAVSDIPFEANFNLSLRCGVYDNPYRFQLFSGSKVMMDFIDIGQNSPIGADYRHWGFTNATGEDGNQLPGDALALRCADAEPATGS